MITVFLKELLDNFRDRRVILTTLVFGPLIGPVLFGVMISFTARQDAERSEAPLELPVDGAEHAPNLVAWLERQGVVVQPAPDDPEQAVLDEEVEVVLRVSEGFAEAWGAGRPARVEIIADGSLRYTNTTLARVSRYLAGYNQQIGTLRLQLRGVHPDLTRPVDAQIIDLSTPTSRGGQVLAFLPYFILITVFMGSMHMAIDTTAGERERRSLEPLLITPLPRWRIMAGKLAATTFFALATLGLGLVAFVYSMGMLPTEDMGIALNLDAGVAARAFLVVAPAGVLAAALLTVLASFAKSFREAQSYLGPVVLIPMIPSFWLLVNPAKAEYWMTWVPLLNQNVMILEMVRGEAIPLMWYVATLVSTFILALMLTAVAGSLYDKPHLVFTSD